MKKSRLLLINCFALLATVCFVSCSDDDESSPAPTITLSEEEFSGKSGQDAEITVNIAAPAGLKNLKITKQINLTTDPSYGTNGVETITPASNPKTYEHTFTYTLSPDEVDQLVSFNFMAEDASGKTSEADLTINTTASGEQIIVSNGWKFKTKQNVTSGTPQDDLAECLKDDVFTYNADGTMAINYGANACQFDGFNEYTGWTLSEDEKTFTQTYRDVFNPAKVTTETYTVTKLTKDEMVLEIFFDLSDFGLSDNEKYVYTMQAVPR
jgi:hypothetical protein